MLPRAGQFWRFAPEHARDATRGSGKREHVGTCESIFTGIDGCHDGKRRQCPGAKIDRRAQAPLIRAGSLLNRPKLRQRESGALAYDCGAPTICEVVCGGGV